MRFTTKSILTAAMLLCSVNASQDEQMVIMPETPGCGSEPHSIPPWSCMRCGEDDWSMHGCTRSCCRKHAEETCPMQEPVMPSQVPPVPPVEDFTVRCLSKSCNKKFGSNQAIAIDRETFLRTEGEKCECQTGRLFAKCAGPCNQYNIPSGHVLPMCQDCDAMDLGEPTATAPPSLDFDDTTVPPILEDMPECGSSPYSQPPQNTCACGKMFWWPMCGKNTKHNLKAGNKECAECDGKVKESFEDHQKTCSKAADQQMVYMEAPPQTGGNGSFQTVSVFKDCACGEQVPQRDVAAHEKNCKKYHAAQPKNCPCTKATQKALVKTPWDGFGCNICNNAGIPINTLMYSCRSCDWDAHVDCVNAGRKRRRLTRRRRPRGRRLSQLPNADRFLRDALKKFRARRRLPAVVRTRRRLVEDDWDQLQQYVGTETVWTCTECNAVEVDCECDSGVELVGEVCFVYQKSRSLGDGASALLDGVTDLWGLKDATKGVLTTAWDTVEDGATQMYNKFSDAGTEMAEKFQEYSKQAMAKLDEIMDCDDCGGDGKSGYFNWSECGSCDGGKESLFAAAIHEAPHGIQSVEAKLEQMLTAQGRENIKGEIKKAVIWYVFSRPSLWPTLYRFQDAYKSEEGIDFDDCSEMLTTLYETY